MSFRIYIHNCESGDYHIGCFIDKVGYYDRTLDKNRFGSIETLITVMLNDEIQPSWVEVDKAIDDAFNQMNKPLEDGRLYELKVPNGKVEILPKRTYAKNADNIKSALREVEKVLIAQGRKKILKS